MSHVDQIIQSPFGEPISPFIKWPGGKSSELSKIQHFSPAVLQGRYIEPFVGAGAVMFGVANSVSKLANDKCWELMRLFHAAKEGPSSEIYLHLKQLGEIWDRLTLSGVALLDRDGRVAPEAVADWLREKARVLPLNEIEIGHLFLERVERDMEAKITRTRKIEEKKGETLSVEDMTNTIESSIRSSFYMSIRERLNDLVSDGEFSDLRAAYFFFIREYAYAAMFRYNSANRFNVPYGGISYNKKSFTKKVSYLFSQEVSEKVREAKFHNLDFEEFLSDVKPTKEDFVFVDPPYDTVFSDYNNDKFIFSDQERLEKALRSLDARVMIVIGQSSAILELYSRGNYWNVESFEKTYLWNVKSRNDGRTRHLVIRNY